MLGGTLDIRKNSPAGTLVTCIFPNNNLEYKGGLNES